MNVLSFLSFKSAKEKLYKTSTFILRILVSFKSSFGEEEEKSFLTLVFELESLVSPLSQSQ